MKKIIILLLCLFPLTQVSSQVLPQDVQNIWKAKVSEIVNEKSISIPGTDVISKVQTIMANIQEGYKKGESVTFENDYIQLGVGDIFYIQHIKVVGGDEFYSVHELYRMNSVFILLGVFVFVLLIFSGFSGLRSLVALAGSIFVIFYILIPQLLAGASPVFLSFIVASIVLFFAIFFTHGFKLSSLVAYLGTFFSVLITGFLAFISIQLINLTGFASDESVYLNFGTGGVLDFRGLLLSAIIIGALGALDDIAITQVAIVKEFLKIKTLKKKEIYKKAMRVGKDHISALINTLVLAYTGASLPILLLLHTSQSSLFLSINKEVFATEIVRALVGSVGLILAVPITTVLAIFVLSKYRSD